MGNTYGEHTQAERDSLFNWNKSVWPAKLVLFGEYAVLGGGEALGMQVPELKLQVRYATSSDANLLPMDLTARLWTAMSFASQRQPPAPFAIESTIPISYGLGSSAALCLALMSIAEKELYPRGLALEERFALLKNMETIFHTASSGVDPMICAAQGPLVVRAKDMALPTFYTASVLRPMGLVLLDVGPKQETNASLIPKIVYKLQQRDASSRLSRWSHYKELTYRGIDSLVVGRHTELKDILAELRRLQIDVGMLDQDVEEVVQNWPGVMGWKAIGAGGGGAVVVFVDAAHVDEIPRGALLGASSSHPASKTKNSVVLDHAALLWRGVLGDV